MLNHLCKFINIIIVYAISLLLLLYSFAAVSLYVLKSVTKIASGTSLLVFYYREGYEEYSQQSYAKCLSQHFVCVSFLLIETHRKAKVPCSETATILPRSGNLL